MCTLNSKIFVLKYWPPLKELGFLRNLDDSRTGSEKAQYVSEAYFAPNKQMLKEDENMPNGHRSHLERDFTDQIWENFTIQICSSIFQP